MSSNSLPPSTLLLLCDVDRLTYRQLQIELKSRQLKAGGRTEVLRRRLRQALLDADEDAQLSDYLDECSICLDKLSFDERTTIVTTCAHRYHRICLKQWMESNAEFSLCCPLCRCSLANDRPIEQDENKKLLL